MRGEAPKRSKTRRARSGTSKADSGRGSGWGFLPRYTERGCELSDEETQQSDELLQKLRRYAENTRWLSREYGDPAYRTEMEDRSKMFTDAADRIEAAEKRVAQFERLRCTISEYRND